MKSIAFSTSLRAAMMVGLLGLSACSRPAAPTAETFVAPLNSYLARRGDLCLGKNTWPIDVTQHEVDVGGRNALQMPVLEKLGLASSSVAQIEIEDEGTKHAMAVRRYALTDAGRKYYLARSLARGQQGGQEDGHGKGLTAIAATGDFCAARLSLDQVVAWELQKAPDSGKQQAVVSYTYRVQAAPWTQDAEVQKVFPVVASIVHGAGSARLQETFTLTDTGWVAVDLL